MTSLAKVMICIALQRMPTPRIAASAPDMMLTAFRSEELSSFRETVRNDHVEAEKGCGGCMKNEAAKSGCARHKRCWLIALNCISYLFVRERNL